MAQGTISVAQGLDLLMLAMEGSVAEPGVLTSTEPELELPIDSFAKAVEQIPDLNPEVVLEFPKATPIEIEPQVGEDEVLVGFEALFTPIPKEEVIYKERPKSTQTELIIKKEVSIGLTALGVPTEPVLKVLSRELPAEDLKHYFPQEPKSQAEPIETAPKQAEKPVQSLQAVPKPVIEAVEKITFTPGQQVEVKVEVAPKVEPIIEKPRKEEIARPVTSKIDTTSHQETLPKEVTHIKEPERPKINEVADKEKTIPEVKSATQKPVLSLEQIQSIHNPEVSAVQQGMVEKTTQVQITPQLIQAKTPQIIHAVALNIKQGIHVGADKITLQLNPPALGKIEIELQFANDGRVNAILYADKIETFDLLQRNPQLLKESISGAGINPETTDLSFNFRGDNHRQEAGGEKPTWSNQTGGSELNTEAVIYRQSAAVHSDKQVDIHA